MILGRKGFQITVGVIIALLLIAYLFFEVKNLFKKNTNNQDVETPVYNTMGKFAVVFFSIIGYPSAIFGSLLLLMGIFVKDMTLLYVSIPMIVTSAAIFFVLIKNGINKRKNKVIPGSDTMRKVEASVYRSDF
jgi:hypothetical protein